MYQDKIKIASLRKAYLDVVDFLEDMEFDDWNSQCESPIERIMAAALFFEMVYGSRMTPMYVRRIEGRYHNNDNKAWLGYSGHHRRAEITIKPQAEISDYRVDFLIEGPGIAIVVECDGHDFHERTKEQAANDKARDRHIQTLGFVVFRFTGSEIFRDPAKCSRQIGEFLEQKCCGKLR